jgi:hypothetical protein
MSPHLADLLLQVWCQTTFDVYCKMTFLFSLCISDRPNGAQGQNRLQKWSFVLLSIKKFNNLLILNYMF